MNSSSAVVRQTVMDVVNASKPIFCVQLFAHVPVNGELIKIIKWIKKY